MFGIGLPEFLLIMAIALIVIGPKKLPDLAKALGKALGEFKKATSELKDSLDIEKPISDVKRSFDNLNKEFHERESQNSANEKKLLSGDHAKRQAVADRNITPPELHGESSENKHRESEVAWEKEDEPKMHEQQKEKTDNRNKV